MNTFSFKLHGIGKTYYVNADRKEHWEALELLTEIEKKGNYPVSYMGSDTVLESKHIRLFIKLALMVLENKPDHFDRDIQEAHDDLMKWKASFYKQ